LLPLSPLALAEPPVAVLVLKAPLALALAPVAVLPTPLSGLPTPLALALAPIAVLLMLAAAPVSALALGPHATEVGPAIAPCPVAVWMSLQTNWATAWVGASNGAAPNAVTMPAAIAFRRNAPTLPPGKRTRRLSRAQIVSPVHANRAHRAAQSPSARSCFMSVPASSGGGFVTARTSRNRLPQDPSRLYLGSPRQATMRRRYG
jgi:hypothetical protein